MNAEKGRKLWEEAEKLIPGGTQLLSKHPDQFLPGLWPAYYEKASGIEIVDLDGNLFYDFSMMGVGSCILGYADADVNNAVIEAVRGGNMCTLNAPEEVELAKIMLDINPWADMVRYARTGGEAMAAAVRLARSCSGRDKIAFCGYHGWHDWYLSANLGGKSALDGHLLPGLKPSGVPRALYGTAFPFTYNGLEELEALTASNDIGVIVMEPVRSVFPEEGFLEGVRRIADRSGAVLVFDEITSGFRLRAGGAHGVFGVEPDIAVYAKAISNGYPMAVVAGRKRVMGEARKSFISSTYWTEKTGPAAAIAAIGKMREKNVPEHLCRTGGAIAEGWKKASGECGLEIIISGIPPLPKFGFDCPNPLAAMTLFTQLMLERGFLARDCVYVSFAHKEEHVKKYLEAAGDVFKIIKKSIEAGKVENMLKHGPALTGFARLA